jgi:hypothetical protein
MQLTNWRAALSLTTGPGLYRFNSEANFSRKLSAPMVMLTFPRAKISHN